jgi:hypothetical protein
MVNSRADTTRWPEDSTRISFSEKTERHYWSGRFHVSPGKLEEAVRAVGPPVQRRKPLPELPTVIVGASLPRGLARCLSVPRRAGPLLNGVSVRPADCTQTLAPRLGRGT